MIQLLFCFFELLLNCKQTLNFKLKYIMSLATIKSILNKSKKINWKLTNAKCKQHAKKIRYCIFKQKDDDSDNEVIIHDVNFNYCTNNFEIYCSETKSLSFKILDSANKIIINNESDAEILIDNKKIFRVKSKYVTISLLIDLNEKTLNHKSKMIGMYVYIYYLFIIHLLYIYYIFIIYLSFI